MKFRVLMSLFGLVLITSGVALILDAGMPTIMAACTPCTATPACNDCPALAPVEQSICKPAVEKIEEGSITHKCQYANQTCSNDPAKPCADSPGGTTAWTAAYCSSTGAGEGDTCSRITVKKDKHKWQTKPCWKNEGAENCSCKAENLANTDGCQCVEVCGS